ncbi:MAG: ABC transporter permease [Verrucomicrobia bacterium]|nr:ABC transporter permease [Verrucomicrobiota bacterium]
MSDLRYALRQLLKNPGFTAVAVLTLALGIGANTAIFSFVHAVLLRPLPYRDPDRLVMVFESRATDGSDREPVAAPMLGHWRGQSTVFEGLAARGGDTFALSGRGPAESLAGTRVSANMFALLGLRPILGRDFLPEEETFGKHRVVLLSHELWQRRFGGDAGIVGQTITVNSEPHTVVGVMPARTLFPEAGTEIWAPLAFSPDLLGQRHNHSFLVHGRLKPGVTLAQARVEMAGIADRMATADPESRDWGAAVHAYHEVLVADSRRTLLVLFAAVGMVLLIGCANIANLQLARAAARSREFAVRAALGAGSWQILRQLLTESLLLAATGGLGGLAVAWGGLGMLTRLAPPNLPRIAEGVPLDGWAVGFAMLASVAAAVMSGLVPALQTIRLSLAGALTEGVRGTSTLGRQRLRAALVVAEVALSLMLLVGAGLLIRSFTRVLAQPAGFTPEHVVTLSVSLPEGRYPQQTDRERLFAELHERVRAIPGVDSAGMILGVPLGANQMGTAIGIPGAPPPPPGEVRAAGYAQVSPDYFRTLQIPFVQGRDFSAQDRTGTPDVVVVDETFVRRFQLGAQVLGRRVDLGDGARGAEIIGVVKDVRRSGLEQAPAGEVYRAYRQNCWGSLSLVVRTARDPMDLTRALRAELDALDRDLPIENVRTMTQWVAASVAQRQLSTRLLGVFAVAALLLAALGLYGVLAYTVTQRTREIGVRMALGAQTREVRRLIVVQGMRLVLLGIVCGSAAALLLTRLLRTLLFETAPWDPATFAGVTVLLMGVALLACWLPARRAARLDPMRALRSEG